MIRAAGRRFFEGAGLASFAFGCEVRGDVPICRGLGSSVTVRLGTLLGLNELTRRPLTREQVFTLCAELEGHPDNAAPGLFGGFTVVAAGACQKIDVSPRLKVVLLVPPFPVATERARRLLPAKISRYDAVRNIGHAARIVAAFGSGRHEQLRGAFHDQLHQPYRRKLVPFLDTVIAAAEDAGALGGFLSGSGSTIAALTLRRPDQVADAMMSAAGLRGARTIITTADNRGARILPA
ncbi:MAG: homoserine kinase [Chthoniobacterales bacterium]